MLSVLPGVWQKSRYILSQPCSTRTRLTTRLTLTGAVLVPREAAWSGCLTRAKPSSRCCRRSRSGTLALEPSQRVMAKETLLSHSVRACRQGRRCVCVRPVADLSSRAPAPCGPGAPDTHPRAKMPHLCAPTARCRFQQYKPCSLRCMPAATKASAGARCRAERLACSWAGHAHVQPPTAETISQQNWKHTVLVSAGTVRVRSLKQGPMELHASVHKTVVPAAGLGIGQGASPWLHVWRPHSRASGMPDVGGSHRTPSPCG